MEAEALTYRGRKKHAYPLYAALFAAAMMLAAYAMLGIWPFGEATILTGDLSAQYTQYYAHFKRFFAGQAGFAYGFDKGLGGGLIGLFAYYVSSPLNLLYLLVPLEWFPVASGFLLAAKTVLASSFACWFLCRKYPQLSWFSVALGLCYGFMAYNMVYAQNIMFHDVVLLLPIVLMGVDKIIGGKTFALYTPMLALMVFANFYIGYMACIFVAIYFLFSMLTNPNIKTRQDWKTPAQRFALGSLLGGGITAVLLLPTLNNVAGSKGSLLAFDFGWSGQFEWKRLPERFLWASYGEGEVSSTIPFVYCGIFVLVLVFCYFSSSLIPLGERLLSGGICAFFLLSFWLNGLDTIWHGLKEPVWFPARYSFVFCLFLILLAARVLACKGADSRSLTFSGGVLFLALLVMAVFPLAISRSRILLSAVAVIFFALVLLMMANAHKHGRKRLLVVALVLVVAGELATNVVYTFGGFELHTLERFQTHVRQDGGTVKAIQAADEADDYRIAENSFYSLNDPMLFGYKSIMHFSSILDSEAQGALSRLGYRSYLGAGPYMSGNTVFADSLLGLKYLYNTHEEGTIPSHWADTAIEAHWPVYENQSALPMLFAASPGTGASPGETAAAGDTGQNMFLYQNGVYTALGGEGELFVPVEDWVLRNNLGERQAWGNIVHPGHYFEVTATTPGRYYAWFDAGYLELPLRIDGEYSDLYFSPQATGVIDLGMLGEGEQVTFWWENENDIGINSMAIVRMDGDKMDAFTAAARQNSGSFAVADGRVAGSITAEAGQTLFTSIPYDENWQCSVNGVKVQQTQLVQGLLAVPLQAGQNEVLLRYKEGGSGLIAIIISLGCFAIYLACLAWEQRLRQCVDAIQTTSDDEKRGE